MTPYAQHMILSGYMYVYVDREGCWAVHLLVSCPCAVLCFAVPTAVSLVFGE